MVMALHAALADADLPGVVETIPSFRALLVAYDPLVASRAGLEAQVRAMLPDLKAQSRAGRLWQLPVCYDPAVAPDLLDVAGRGTPTPDAGPARQPGGRYSIGKAGGRERECK